MPRASLRAITLATSFEPGECGEQKVDEGLDRVARVFISAQIVQFGTHSISTHLYEASKTSAHGVHSSGVLIVAQRCGL